jgi:hypothetical protein
MDYTTWTVPTQVRVEDKVVMSLYEALQGLVDPRRGQGKRYPLAVILSLLVLAKLVKSTKSEQVLR